MLHVATVTVNIRDTIHPSHVRGVAPRLGGDIGGGEAPVEVVSLGLPDQ